MKYDITIEVSGEKEPYTANEIEATDPEEAVNRFLDEMEITCLKEKSLKFLKREKRSIQYQTVDDAKVIIETVISVTEST